MPRLIHAGLVALASLVLCATLAGCTISSSRPLLDPAEGAAPLPDAFTFFAYKPSANGYIPSGDAPSSFARDGNHYVSNDIPNAKGPLSVTLLPIDEGTYLLAATIGSKPGTIYGFARYTDGVVAIALSPDKATFTALAHEHHAAMPQARKALRGLAASRATSEITLTSRAALDYLGTMYAERRLPMGQLSVGYLSEDPTAPPPSRLVASGADWIKVP